MEFIITAVIVAVASVFIAMLANGSHDGLYKREE